MSESRRVLVIEDDADLRRLLTLHLSDLGMQVRHAADGLTGLDLAMTTSPELIILDLKLPGMDGLEVCRRVRQTREYIPILMLTSRSSETDRVVGLEVGADDYLTKPFSVQELLARVKAMFRRGDAMSAPKKEETPEVLEFGDLRIESAKRRVTLRGEPV
ncbi:MAG: response regulator transcription factor, partial [Verrucomicrobiaceae bacterium]